MNECPICPIMSIGADDYTSCVGERCACWKYEDCGLIHTAPDLYDIEQSFDSLTEAVQVVAREIHRNAS